MEPRSDKQKLFKKYLKGIHTVDELEELLRYFQLDSDDEGLAGVIVKELERVPQTDEMPLIESMATEVKARLNHMVGMESIRDIRWRWSAVAAGVAILLAVGAFLFFEKRDSRQETLDNRLAATEILPGGNRATLTLADGRTITLDEAQSGIIVENDDITYADGSLISEARDKSQETRDRHIGSLDSRVLHLASISTPKGGTYTITLPDGSKVWLNAASTLKYPSRFSDDERVVELEGEAYFEVARSRKTAKSQSRDVQGANQPFKVVTKDQTVEVLGTQFNLSAYSDDPATKTTLVEGSVKVSSAGSGQANSQLLMPGEQAIEGPNGLTKQRVDVRQFTAWKDGTFSFSEEPLESILRQASRWYDVSIAYADPGLKTELFEGLIPRYADLGQLLGALESAGDVRFEMEDRAVRVYRKRIK